MISQHPLLVISRAGSHPLGVVAMESKEREVVVMEK